MSLVSKVQVQVQTAIDYKSALDAGDVSFNPTITFSNALANGAGANQASKVFTDQRTLAGSTSEELDLAGGLTDAFGATLTFTIIKAIIVSAASANGNDIDVGGSATNGFNTWVGAVGDIVSVPPGGMFAITAPDAGGFAVTAATGDLLKIANTDASSATYDIILIGV